MVIKKVLLPPLAFALLLSACSNEDDGTPFSNENLPRANSTILPPSGKADRPQDVISFEEFLNYVFCEEDDRVCVVDGDTPIPGGLDNLRYFYDTRVQPSIGAVQQELSVNLGQRGDDLWYGEQRFDLSFCISDEFGDRKAEVVEATLEAMAQWEEIAAVKFPYREDQDHRCHLDNRQVLFPIWPAEPDAPYFARAFFPSSAKEERDIRINLYQFDAALNHAEMSNITITGIMRHELGHVLGFRHEHTRDEADAYYCFEDRNYRPGTGYDSDSVMHYPQCKGTNDWSLPFSQTDIIGARYFYPEAGVEVLGRCQEELDSNGFVLPTCEPVVRQITEWLSKYNANTFLSWTPLPESLWERIQVESYLHPFTDLEDLKARTQILDEEIRALYDYLFVNGRCPGWEFNEDGWISPLCYPVVNQILYLANNASFEELDSEVRLDRRAAENIVAVRQVREIDTYDALISLGYVKRTALWAMYTHLYPNWESEQTADDADENDPANSPGCESFSSNSLALPSCGAGPLTVTFDATALLGGLDYIDPTWDFGDGRTRRGVNVEHTYIFEGDYDATFTARVTGNGWAANMELGSIKVRVLTEEE